MCAELRIIVDAANYLIKFENCVVEHQWLSQFLKQYPNFHFQKQKPLVAKWRNSHSVTNMQDDFDKLDKTIKKKT